MEIEEELNTLQCSQAFNKYYNSDRHISEETKFEYKNNPLIISNGQPILIGERIKEPEIINKSIVKYKFMNDGIWMKILIDRNEYPEIGECSITQMNIQFSNNSVELNINANPLLVYTLKINKTREEIIPEKCKLYERKHYIYIGLYKTKIGDWWSLKW